MRARALQGLTHPVPNFTKEKALRQRLVNLLERKKKK